MALQLSPWRPPGHQPLQEAPKLGNVSPPDMAAFLQNAIGGLLPTLASSYKNVQGQATQEKMGAAFRAAQLGQPGGPYGPATPASGTTPPAGGAPYGPAVPASPQTTYDANKPLPPDLDAKIKAASAQTGLPEDYYRRVIGVESTGNATIINPKSGAMGYFQFLPSTGAKYGLNRQNLGNVDLQFDAFNKFTAGNKAELTAALGREPTIGELGVAHQQGVGGALKAIRNPDKPVADVLGKNALSNLGELPKTATAREFVDYWGKRYGGVGYTPPGTPKTVATGPGQRTYVAPGAGAVTGGSKVVQPPPESGYTTTGGTPAQPGSSLPGSPPAVTATPPVVPAPTVSPPPNAASAVNPVTLPGQVAGAGGDPRVGTGGGAAVGGAFTGEGLNVRPVYQPGQVFGRQATAEKQPYQGIVLHHTATSDLQSALNTSRGDPSRGGHAFGYHFYVDRDGTVIQGAPMDARTNHIKGTSQQGLSNRNAIGVSLVGNSDDATPQQIEAATRLTQQLAQQTGIPTARIYGHGEIQGNKQHNEGAPVLAQLRGGVGGGQPTGLYNPAVHGQPVPGGGSGPNGPPGGLSLESLQAALAQAPPELRAQFEQLSARVPGGLNTLVGMLGQVMKGGIPGMGGGGGGQQPPPGTAAGPNPAPVAPQAPAQVAAAAPGVVPRTPPTERATAGGANQAPLFQTPQLAGATTGASLAGGPGGDILADQPAPGATPAGLPGGGQEGGFVVPGTGQVVRPGTGPDARNAPRAPTGAPGSVERIFEETAQQASRELGIPIEQVREYLRRQRPVAPGAPPVGGAGGAGGAGGPAGPAGGPPAGGGGAAPAGGPGPGYGPPGGLGGGGGGGGGGGLGGAEGGGMPRQLQDAIGYALSGGHTNAANVLLNYAEKNYGEGKFSFIKGDDGTIYRTDGRGGIEPVITPAHAGGSQYEIIPPGDPRHPVPGDPRPYQLDRKTGQMTPISEPSRTDPKAPVTQVLNGVLHQYDPQTKEWTPVAGTPETKTPATQMINGVLHEYDPQTKQWTPKAGTPETKAPVTQVLNGVLHQYDPVTKEWTPVAGETKTAEWTNATPEQIRAAGYDPAAVGGGAQINAKTGEIRFPAKAGGTSVVVNPGEKKEEEELGKARAEGQIALRKAADAGRSTMAQTAQFRDLLRRANTGALAKAGMTIGAIAQGLGLSDETLKSLGISDKNTVATQQVIDSMTGGFLSGKLASGQFPSNNFSNVDRQFLTQQLPSLQNTPIANALLLRAMELDAQRAIEKQRAWAAYRGKHGADKADFDAFRDEWDEKLEGTGRSLYTTVKSSEEALKLPKGTIIRIENPDGSATWAQRD